MYTLIGISRKSGTYEGHDYDNFTLYLTRALDPNVDGNIGDFCIAIKVKAEILLAVGVPDIGDDITVYYDNFGRVATVVVN